MAQVEASIDIPVSPDEIWQLIGGFGSLPDWLNSMPTSKLTDGGRVRWLANIDGETLIERLVAFDDAARSYSYSFLEAPFPVTDHLATLRVQPTDGGKGSRVEWFARFEPNGVTGQEASQLIRLIQRIFDDGLKALAAKLASE
jgi:uncharacterized protein YndB with AHSA1/START domain